MTDSPLCKHHTGIKEAVDNLKETQADHKVAIVRLWKALDSKLSVKMFLGILSASVTITGLVIGFVFGIMLSNQDKVLTALQASQARILDQVNDLKLDIGVIKHEIKPNKTGKW